MRADSAAVIASFVSDYPNALTGHVESSRGSRCRLTNFPVPIGNCAHSRARKAMELRQSNMAVAAGAAAWLQQSLMAYAPRWQGSLRLAEPFRARVSQELRVAELRCDLRLRLLAA